MHYQDAMKEIGSVRQDMMALRERIREIQGAVEPQAIEDYLFQTLDGSVKLSDLFGDKDTLFVIHNMGASCSYCTQWADGLNGVYNHLQDRAAFAISSPDAPKVQAEFAKGRGWHFTMVSHKGTSFANDMGYKTDKHFMPGVSVFRMNDGQMTRVSDTQFGPYDVFNPVWNLFDMMPEGAGEWQPRFSYS